MVWRGKGCVRQVGGVRRRGLGLYFGISSRCMMRSVRGSEEWCTRRREQELKGSTDILVEL